MDRIRALVLGLGNFGRSWADLVVPACGDCAVLAGAADRRPETWTGIGEEVPKFTDLTQALEAVKPDLVINATPPDAHFPLTAGLLRGGYPVLCEKPIADTYENALRLCAVLEETGGFLMIGENYRYHPVFREAKRLLQTEDLGEIRHVQCSFRHFHPDYSRFYHGSLRHPLLEDVTIHHLDLARYLSGKEPVRVWCREYGAPYSWYGDRPATAFLLTEMTGGTVFRYGGTLASAASSTDWNGDWEIECGGGVLKIEQSRIFLIRGEERTEVLYAGTEEDSRIPMLREACAALRERRSGETDLRENMKSFRWMHAAVRSSERQEWFAVEEL